MPRFALRRPLTTSEAALIALLRQLVNPLREQVGLPLLTETEVLDLFRALMRQAETPGGP